MKILVIFTGGTIGSTVNDGWIAPDPSARYTLLKEYRKKHGDSVELETLTPYTALSENLTAKELTTLIKCVCHSIGGDYQGIIVTHGTDTLQYSAAALGFALGNLSKPVILVSANYPLGDERSNGNINFDAAVEFIKAKKGRGVFISYSNTSGSVDFHRSTRALHHTETEDFILSLGGKPYASFAKGEIELNCDYSESPPSEGVGAVEFLADPGIIALPCMPGNGYSYDLSRCNAVILMPYHSGTLPTADPAFRDFCKRAEASGVPLFAVNVKGGNAYESSRYFEELGITALPFCGFIPIYIKLWIGISLKKSIREFALTPLAGELLPD